MIESMLTENCQILSRQETSISDENEFDYDLSDDVSCLFIDMAGEIVKDDFGNYVIISGYLVLKEAVNEGDKIVYDSYEYDVVVGGIGKRKDWINGEVDHYRVALGRRRLYNEQSVNISEST